MVLLTSSFSYFFFRSMFCRRICLCLARFGPFACRCLLSYDVQFDVDSTECWRRRRETRRSPLNEMAVSDAAAFLMTLSSADLSNILLECHMSRWQKWFDSTVTLCPDLWMLSSLVTTLSENGAMFSEVDALCGNDAVECGYAFACSCERPLRVSTFIGVMGWLARKCRVEIDGKVDMVLTKATCDAVAVVLSPCLMYLR